MFSLPILAQLEASNPQGWWWSTLTSRPALVLLALAVGCLLVMGYLGYRLKQVASAQRAVALRQRLANDSGYAMVEFVLVTPVLLGLTLTLLQTMLVFTGLFYVQYAAFAAARAAIVQIPSDLNESRNFLTPVRGSDKFDAIEGAAMLAVMPVSGRESGSNVAVSEIVAGVAEVYQAQGENTPPWVEGMLAERLHYAINHTEVTIEKVRPAGEGVEFDEVTGTTEFSPKEAISAKVSHEFALSIPVASKIFTLAGGSGDYTPASRFSDSPPPPGQWTLIEARAILTNEGINPMLPDPPRYPRIDRD